MINEKLLEKLKILQAEYNEILKLTTDPEVLRDAKKYAEVSKREKRMQVKGAIANKFFDFVKEIKEAEEIISMENDKEMISMMEEQIRDSKKAIESMFGDIEEALTEIDPADELDAIIEIEGKAGGDEANIFAGDLYKMYQRWAAKNEATIEVIEASSADVGGFTSIQFAVRGVNVFGYLRYESGIHRVQRVPATETQGRVHTSTAAVHVVPEVDSTIDIEIKTSEIRIDTYRSGGKGGQHANKTDSAVRITHIPTGVVATSSEGRSQHDNKDRAMQTLKSRLYEAQLRKQQSNSANAKAAAIGSGDRSEKIRTYNYPQNRITDHRVGLTLKKLDRVMDGGLDEVIDFIRATIKNEDQN